MKYSWLKYKLQWWYVLTLLYSRMRPCKLVLVVLALIIASCRWHIITIRCKICIFFKYSSLNVCMPTLREGKSLITGCWNTEPVLYFNQSQHCVKLCITVPCLGFAPVGIYIYIYIWTMCRAWSLYHGYPSESGFLHPVTQNMNTKYRRYCRLEHFRFRLLNHRQYYVQL